MSDVQRTRGKAPLDSLSQRRTRKKHIPVHPIPAQVQHTLHLKRGHRSPHAKSPLRWNACVFKDRDRLPSDLRLHFDPSSGVRRENPLPLDLPIPRRKREDPLAPFHLPGQVGPPSARPDRLPNTKVSTPRRVIYGSGRFNRRIHPSLQTRSRKHGIPGGHGAPPFPSTRARGQGGWFRYSVPSGFSRHLAQKPLHGPHPYILNRQGRVHGFRAVQSDPSRTAHRSSSNARGGLVYG